MIESKYIVGNSKEIENIFKKFEISKPNLIISSPPYYDVLNYEDNKKQIGFGQGSYDEYLNDVVNVFQECYNLSHEDATFWLIVDTFKKEGETITLPFDINSEFKRRFNKNTWKLKEIIIWDKEKNLPWNGKGKFKNQYEYVLFYSKNESFKFNIDKVREINDLKKWWKKYPERYNPDGKAPSNIWEFTTPLRGWGNGKQNHLCPFPFPLIEKIISISSNEDDIIFDPFAGSGSVLAIAKQMKRNSIGIDINKNYYKIFMKEVRFGAEQYWNKRIIELAKIKNQIINFKKTNENLRKQKTINYISKYLNTINNCKNIYLAINSTSNKIKLYLLRKRSKQIIDIRDDKLTDLIRQTKIDVEIIIISKNNLFEKLKETKLYKYHFDKFYFYTASTQFERIIKNKDFENYFYSNICMKI
jgi:DNA modification methylase